MVENHRGIGMTSQRTRERLVQRLRAQGVVNESVLGVMRSTPRHIFVDEALASRAYEDTALPIGFAQTISQPYSVARMTEILLACARPVKKVLEIGTGSGYQTAVLSQLVENVFTVERIQALQSKARQRMRELNLKNVRFKFDDGNLGWSEHGPFDGIIVTAAPIGVPQALLEQLAPGGRLVIPAGVGGSQKLRCIDFVDGEYSEELVENVVFVPMLEGTV